MRILAAGLSRALGEPAHYRTITPEQYRALDFPGADLARELNPQLQRFDDWLRDNARRIPRA